MKTWITSDLHLGHGNILKFCPKTRGHFQNVTDMNERMILEWNRNVSDGDTVYILGDVAFMPADKTANMLQRMNGNKILIEGNHDRKNLKDAAFKRCFREIHQYLALNYNGHRIVMFHYPIMNWDAMHHGAIHFHGHCHGSPTGLEEYRCRDIGYDATGRIITLLDDAIADAMKGKIKGHH